MTLHRVEQRSVSFSHYYADSREMHDSCGMRIIAKKAPEEASQLLDDHIVMTQSMSFSPFKKPFEKPLWELSSGKVVNEPFYPTYLQNKNKGILDSNLINHITANQMIMR